MAAHKSNYFHVREVHDIPVLVLDVHEIRHPTPAQEFGADVYAMVDPGGHRKLVLDLDRVRYMSSTGFAVLANLAKKVQEAGGQIALCNIDPDVAVGANIIGLGRIVPTFPTREEAVESLLG